jgi:hypothetical protein
MDMFKRVLVSGFLIVSMNVHAGELVVRGPSLRAPSALGKVKLIKNAYGFSFKSSTGVKKSIEPAFVDSALRSMDTNTLAKILAAGNNYVALSPLSDGDYALRLNGQLKAGGPITGLILGWGTRVLGYGVLGAGAAGGVAVVVGTGGAAAAGITSLAMSAATGGAVGSAGIAAGAAASSIAANAAAAEVAALSSAALAIESAAVGTTIVAYVEGAAVAAQAAGTALWFLP